jgi:hypothetical protein
MAFLLTACVSLPGAVGQSGYDTAPGVAPAHRGPPRGNGPITREEVEASTQTDAYRLVYKARPGWLRARSPGGIGVNGVAAIRAYVDGMPVGAADYLKQVPISVVESVIFLNGMEATQRFGTNHGNGAILVTTRS